MPRKPRFTLPGVPQHIIQRGNNREACFLSEPDYRRYLDAVHAAAEHHACRLHAYVLMTNHVHVLLTPMHEHGIGELMQALGRRYVYYINKTYKRTGTLWPLLRIPAPGRSRPPASRGITTSLCGAAFVPPCTSGRTLSGDAD